MKDFRIKILFLSLCLLSASSLLYGQELQTADGPYLFHLKDGGLRLLSVDTAGVIHDEIVSAGQEDISFPVYAHNKKHLFDVHLHPVVRQEWENTLPEKVLVMSDPHGNLECFVSTLRMNGVIDKNYGWTFGSNHLMIIGDVFDRGNDVLPIFWLLYKLEHEAQNAGGQVSFLLGNHESIVLAGDLRYLTEKYKNLSEKSGIPYQEFFGRDTELGRWLATRNTMQMIGDNLFVHAGLGADFLAQQLSPAQVNSTISQALFMPVKARREHSALTAFLFGTYGPLWYRGMVRNDEKYVPLEPETLDSLLQTYNARRIIVGHTIFPDIRSFYNGKVLTVNVDNQENFKEVLGRGLLIEGTNTFVISDKGILHRLH